MKTAEPIKLDNRISLIDGFDLGVAHRTGTYVIDEEQLTLIETGPSPAIKHIKAGLEVLGFALEDVRYIIVTHVHLDHAGGAGVLIKECPNAKVVVHPRGARHIEDPTKLVAGAKGVYGESFSELFDPVLPVPEELILTKDEGDTLKLSDKCILTFLDTPGHAKHHFSIYDPISKGVFTGDTVGVRYDQLIEDGVELYLPSTSPNHFNPSDMHESIKRVQDMDVERIYYGHFGMTNKPELALQQVANWLDIFMEEAEQVFVEEKGYDVLSGRLLNRVRAYLREQGITDEHEVYILINLDMQVSALGIIDYYQKLKQ